MNELTRKQTESLIKKLAKKSGSYEALAQELCDGAEKRISGQAVYQWMLRGKIPEYWWPFVQGFDGQ